MAFGTILSYINRQVSDMKRMINIVLVMLLVLAGFGGAKAFAGENSSSVMVMARVLPYVSSTVLSQPSTINITPEDLKRGYIEVEAGTVIEIRTNSRDGYMLSFEVVRGPFEDIWVVDGDRSTVLSGGSGFVYQPSEDAGVVRTKVLSYKIHLAEGTEPGVYPWPVKVDVVTH